MTQTHRESASALRTLASSALSLAGLCLGSIALAEVTEAAPQDGEKLVGDSVADQFHPAKGDGKPALYGGRVIVHLPTLPKGASYVIENLTYNRNFLYEVTDTLLLRDWWTTDLVPNAAKAYVVEDLVVLNADAPPVAGETEVEVIRRDGTSGRRAVRGVYGSVKQEAGSYLVTPSSKGSLLEEATTLPGSSVERVERGSVFTFELNEGVQWQQSVVYEGEAAAKIKGQTLDANDIYFSWDVYNNPAVNCDEKRFNFTKFTRCEVIDPLTVRFFCEKQDAFALSQLGVDLTLLPSHIYNLSDPDCPDYNAKATVPEQGENINDNLHNQLWVGIGAYQIVKWSQEFVEAVRFVDEKGEPAYFAQSTRPGYVDSIRWRYIGDDEQAVSALLNDEIDFFARIKSEDYFSGRTLEEDFTKSFYKGYFYTGYFGFTGWNLYHPALKDPAVRKAIAHSFDFQSYLANQYNGLGYQVTGPIPYISPVYNHDVKPLAYDPDLALEILEDAGWYDRDGNDIADKDGVELELEFLYPNGNDASKIMGRALQKAVEHLGIKFNLETMEGATFFERVKKREFDSCNMAWVSDLESDPEQLWHSRWGDREKMSSNNSGLQDAEVDRLIEAIQAETDRAARGKLYKEFHAKIYELQPYLFMYSVPRKYAANLNLRGIRHTPISPGYVIRDWYYSDAQVPGTRKSLK